MAKVEDHPRLLSLSMGGAGLSIVVWGIAMATPALYLADTKTGALQDWSGAACALLGPFAIFSGCPAWLANATSFGAIASLLARRYGLAASLAGISLLLGLSTMLLFSTAVALDEAGANEGRLVHLGIGFHLWMASLVIPGLAALLCRRRLLLSSP